MTDSQQLRSDLAGCEERTEAHSQPFRSIALSCGGWQAPSSLHFYLPAQLTVQNSHVNLFALITLIKQHCSCRRNKAAGVSPVLLQLLVKCAAVSPASTRAFADCIVLYCMNTVAQKRAGVRQAGVLEVDHPGFVQGLSLKNSPLERHLW